MASCILHLYFLPLLLINSKPFKGWPYKKTTHMLISKHWTNNGPTSSLMLWGPIIDEMKPNSSSSWTNYNIVWSKMKANLLTSWKCHITCSIVVYWSQVLKQISFFFSFFSKPKNHIVNDWQEVLNLCSTSNMGQNDNWDGWPPMKTIVQQPYI
jgi:hypothetical protein